MANKLSIVAEATRAQFDALGAIKSAVVAIFTGANALEIVNAKAKELKDNGIVFGKSVKTCAYRVMMMDSFASTFKGKSSKTYANYVTSFVGAVNDNVPFSFSSSKSGTKGTKGTKSGAKTDKKSDAQKMIDTLLNVWKLSDVAEDILIEVEVALEGGVPLAQAIENVLKAHKVKLD
jgi:hypothetical protein